MTGPEQHAGFEDLDLGRLRRRRSEKWRAHPPDVLPAFIAEMDYDLAPPVRDALRAAVDLGDCGYANPDGLSEAFALFCAERAGWAVDAGRVFLMPDVMAGVEALLGLLTSPGDGVVINPPVYPPFYEHVAVAGRRVVEVPMIRAAGRWALDVPALEAAFSAGARAYLLCSPHNPTGRVFSRTDLTTIADLSARYGVAVLSDEIHAPLTLPGAAHTPFVSLGDDAARNAVTLTSASKAFNIAGLKCAVAVAGSEAMRRRMSLLPEDCRFGAGLLGVLASVAAWRSGGPWLGLLLAQLDRMRAEFGRLLAERIPEAVYVPPEAGYLAWVDCSAVSFGPGTAGTTATSPAAAFHSRGRVAVADGRDFGAAGEGFVRVTFGTSTRILTEITDRMAAAVRS